MPDAPEPPSPEQENEYRYDAPEKLPLVTCAFKSTPPPPPFLPLDCITDPSNPLVAASAFDFQLAQQFTPPAATPPNGNVDLNVFFNKLVNKGLLGQEKAGCLGIRDHVVAGNLAVNPLNAWERALVVPFGKVGIGIAEPTAHFQVETDTKLWGASQALAFGKNYTPKTDGLVMAILTSTGGAKCHAVAQYCTAPVSSGGTTTQHCSIPEAGKAAVNGDIDTASFTFPAINGSGWQVDVTQSNAGTGQCGGNVSYYPLGKVPPALLINIPDINVNVALPPPSPLPSVILDVTKVLITPAPTVALTGTVFYTGSFADITLTWTSTNATSCQAVTHAGTFWTGSKPTNGTFLVDNAIDILSFPDYTLTCSGAGGSTSDTAKCVGGTCQ